MILLVRSRAVARVALHCQEAPESEGAVQKRQVKSLWELGVGSWELWVGAASGDDRRREGGARHESRGTPQARVFAERDDQNLAFCRLAG